MSCDIRLLQKAVISFTLLAVLILPSVSASVEQIQLFANTVLSNHGVFTLNWQAQTDSAFEVQQSANNGQTFTTIYTGKDRATVITGLHDGEYLYRASIRQLKSISLWSESIAVNVVQHLLPTAFTFFAVGAFVFVATLRLIICGSVRTSRKEEN